VLNTKAMQTKKPATVPKLERPINPLIIKLRKLKATIKSATAEIHNDDGEGVEDQLLVLMANRGLPTITIKHDGIHVTATAVHGTREVLDPEMLKKRLGVAKWGKVTTLTLDNKKLQDAMARGLVDPNIVAECSSSMPSKPYIKLTDKK
jgi:hypothetical protein